MADMERDEERHPPHEEHHPPRTEPVTPPRERGGMGWLWILIALVVIALLLWWLWPEAEVDEVPAVETEIGETLEPTDLEPLDTELEGLSLAAILANPSEWIGRTVDGQGVVAEVPTDRGFWIEDEGARVFALLVDRPSEQPLDITAGQTLRLSNATVRDADTDLDDVPGRELDQATRDIISEQDVFLVINEEDISIESPQMETTST